MTVLDYYLVEEGQVLDQEGFDLESLEHFQRSVGSLSDFPWTAFSEKSSANNQTGWWLQYRFSLQIARQFCEAQSALLVLILAGASSESPLSY